ncbi:peptidyl-prolyl cis-trans isomerase [bacterium]|nr:peptidyl-prolyl cis-trans isomerase [bacterium]
MLRNLVTGVMLVCTVILFGGCKGSNDNLEIKSGLVARVGDEVIKMRELEARKKSLPPAQRKKFEGEAGRAKLVDEMIKERVVYLAALENKLQNRENIRTELDYSRRLILIRAYYGKLAEEMVVSDKEIKEYYENNEFDYMTNSIIKAQHIFSRDSLKAVEWKERIDSSDDKYIFNKIAKAESEDSTTAKENGVLGSFNPSGYIKFVGKDKKFGNAVDWLSVGEISDVIAYDKGYSIVKILEKKQAKLKPIEDVRESIIKSIKSSKIKEVVVEDIERLEKKYHAVNYLRENLIKNTKSAEELWELAQDETSPEKKIIYYRAIAHGYPDHKFAPQALFMTAFTYSEELGDFSFARRALEELFKKYPDSEIIESAKWLEENMGKKTFKLDSADDIKKEMNKD